MDANKLTAAILDFTKAIIGLFAIILGGVAVWKIGTAFFTVDAKTAAEVAACFAITFYCLK